MSAVFVGVKVNGKPIYAVRELDPEKGIVAGVILGDMKDYDILRERNDIGFGYVEVKGAVEFCLYPDLND